MPMCDIPIEVAGTEKIVRIVTVSHLNDSKTKLKPRAFRSRPGCDEVSVIRNTYKDATFCKTKAQELAAKSGIEYVGLAVLVVQGVRAAGSEVHDSREEFCGHAHISHGIMPGTPNEPLPPVDNLTLDKRVEVLCSIARYLRDPEPQAGEWTGPEL
jgi:hypothetical protein